MVTLQKNQFVFCQKQKSPNPMLIQEQGSRYLLLIWQLRPIKANMSIHLWGTPSQRPSDGGFSDFDKKVEMWQLFHIIINLFFCRKHKSGSPMVNSESRSSKNQLIWQLRPIENNISTLRWGAPPELALELELSDFEEKKYMKQEKFLFFLPKTQK